MHASLATLPSDELLVRVSALVRRDCAVEADWLAHLGEVDARRLYLDEGCPSMFAWCQRALHFAEGVAYKRIQAARAARHHPALLGAVRSGALHLTAVGLLAPHLTRANCRELVAAARHRSAEEIRRLLADRAPKPSVSARVRKVATPADASAQAPASAVPLVSHAEASPASVPLLAPPSPTGPAATPPARMTPRPEPLGGERYCVRFTADRDTHEQLQELRALLRHQVPDGDLGKILSRAIRELLAKVRGRKFAETDEPRRQQREETTTASPSRHIPAAIRRTVATRDEGRCTYVSPRGRRCGAREFLEFDHREPWARNRHHSVEGITLRCRAHNQQRARRDFGERHMQRFAGRKRRAQLDSDQVGPEPPRERERERDG